MKNRTNRLNRMLLAIVGVLFLLLGAGGILLSTGVFGNSYAMETVVDSRTEDFFDRHDGWLWWTIGGIVLLLALLALYWLIVQLRVERLNRVPLEHSEQGSITLLAGGLANAVANEARTVAGVSDARARLTSQADHPELRLDVWLRADADLTTAHDELAEVVLPHARETLETSELHTWLRIEIDTTARPRVL